MKECCKKIKYGSRNSRHGRPHEAPSTTPRRQRRRRAKSLSGITFTSLLVLSVAIAATVFTCVEYLMLQNNVSQLEKTLIAMEESLDQKIKANDAAYDQMNQAYDLEYIYKVAVEELGMVYPNNNTIITYQKSNSDYVKQFSDIPK